MFQLRGSFFYLLFSGILCIDLALESDCLAQVTDPEAKEGERNSPIASPAEDAMVSGMRARVRERLERFHHRMEQAQEEEEITSRPSVDMDGRGGMGKYLQRAESLVRAVSDSQTSVALSALGIRDLFRKQGRVLEAVPVLQGFLNDTKAQGERNIYLFLIRQCFREVGDNEKYLEISRQIIIENRKAVKPEK